MNERNRQLSNEFSIYFQEMNVFKEITEIYILVPALLCLKGNL